MRGRLNRLEKKLEITPDEQTYLSKQIDGDTYTIQAVMMTGKPQPKKLTRAEYERFSGVFSGRLIQVEWHTQKKEND